MPIGRQKGNTCSYWLRSSMESEWDYRVNRLRTPADLRELIEYVDRTGDNVHAIQCHAILVQSLAMFLGGDQGSLEMLRGLNIETLVQHAGETGFWNAPILPGVHLQMGIFCQGKPLM
jgi:hypothetical protein